MKRTNGALARMCVGGGLVLGFATLVVSPNARAETTRFFDLEGFGTFLDGNPESTAVTEDGAVALPPRTRDRLVDASAVWSAATVAGDDVIVARADTGEVLAVDASGKKRSLFQPPETMVTALWHSGRELYVATATPAKIYKVDKQGKGKVFYTPTAAFVWQMTGGPDGSLLCVTGEPGTVTSIDSKGRGKAIFESEQTHLRSLTYDRKLGLFVGGGEHGVLFRSSDMKSFRAIYDSGFPEMTAVLARDGFAYVAAVDGAEALAQAGEEGTPEGKGGPTVRSQLARVGMDGSAEVLAGSNDEAIFALAFDKAGNVIVATGATGREDPRGRLYSVTPRDRIIALLYQSPSRRITQVVTRSSGDLVVLASAGGRITDVGAELAERGEFFTTPFDTGITSRFGLVQLFGLWPKGTDVSASVRTGQTEDPDAAWSAWSDGVKAPGDKSVAVDNGRYVQVRLTLEGDGRASPRVHRVRVAYLRQNLPPFVREVVALRKGLALRPILREDSKSKTVSLGDKAGKEARRGNGNGDDDEEDRGPATRAKQVEAPGSLTLKWLADDPNGDNLTYNLKVRRVDDAGDWRLVKDKLADPFYSVDSSQLPDGHYQFRVDASDAPSNPKGLERTDTRESRAVLVDNTPPKVAAPDVKVRGRSVSARTEASDEVGPLVLAEYSLDGDDFHPLAPQDGVLDGPVERFVLELGELTPGTHMLSVRVRDEAENDGHGQIQFVVR